jgi:hypothetical protein
MIHKVIVATDADPVPLHRAVAYAREVGLSRSQVVVESPSGSWHTILIPPDGFRSGGVRSGNAEDARDMVRSYLTDHGLCWVEIEYGWFEPRIRDSHMWRRQALDGRLCPPGQEPCDICIGTGKLLTGESCVCGNGTLQGTVLALRKTLEESRAMPRV